MAPAIAEAANVSKLACYAATVYRGSQARRHIVQHRPSLHVCGSDLSANVQVTRVERAVGQPQTDASCCSGSVGLTVGVLPVR